MLVGAHVSTAGGLLTAYGRARELRAEVVQIFCLSPRQWRGPRPAEETLAAYRAEGERLKMPTFCHAPYLINLATEDRELAKKSFDNLVDNLATATALGSAGVVLHVGSHLGRGIEAVLGEVGGTLAAALDAAGEIAGERSCRLLLENTAGAGGTIGRSFDELAALLAATGADERLGFCLDTQHLFASGVSYATVEESDEVVAAIEETIEISRLGLVHLNDSKVELGSNRDRHENLGEGLIGMPALGSLLSHPDLAGVPVALEVPGAGDGPRREDVTRARRMLAAGRRRRAAS